jgi:hypothetical protein
MCVRAGSVAHPGTTLIGLRLGSWLPGPHPPKPLTPNVGVTAATNLFIWTLANEDRAVCRSPRGEGSPSAFCGGRDGDYADRVFSFDDLVLSALLKQQSRRRSESFTCPTAFSTCRPFRSSDPVPCTPPRSVDRFEARQSPAALLSLA